MKNNNWKEQQITALKEAVTTDIETLVQEWINKCMEPEDLFSEDALHKWALANGYTQPAEEKDEAI